MNWLVVQWNNAICCGMMKNRGGYLIDDVMNEKQTR